VTSPLPTRSDVTAAHESVRERSEVVAALDSELACLLPVQHTNKTANKRRAWRPLKHLVSLERSLPFPEDAATYCRIEAPPSFVPAKKYSDISGLPALYTDPHSKLRYSTAEEYKLIQTLPSDIVAGYLALRKAFNPVG